MHASSWCFHLLLEVGCFTAHLCPGTFIYNHKQLKIIFPRVIAVSSEECRENSLKPTEIKKNLRCMAGEVISQSFVDYLFMWDVQKLPKELGLCWPAAVQTARDRIAV